MPDRHKTQQAGERDGWLCCSPGYLDSLMVPAQAPVRVTPVVVDPCALRVKADRLIVCSHRLFHHSFSCIPPRVTRHGKSDHITEWGM
jgi:hypothetical protein